MSQHSHRVLARSQSIHSLTLLEVILDPGQRLRVPALSLSPCVSTVVGTQRADVRTDGATDRLVHDSALLASAAERATPRKAGNIRPVTGD